MSYANLVNITCTDKTEFFTRMRDFICKRNGTYDYSATGIGWTLHDSSYAVDEDSPAINDWFVIYSAGEGTKDDLYFKCTWVSAYIKFEGYQSWDSTTHAGSTNKYNVANNFTMPETGTYILWLYGDLDGIYVINNLLGGNSCYGVNFGKLAPGWDDLTGEIAACSSALTAGSDVRITVDSAPAEWAIGREIFIRTTHDNAMTTVKIEKITIKTITGNVITADLSNSYTAGASLSDFVGYYCQGSNQMASTNYGLISEQGTINAFIGIPRYLALTTEFFNPGQYEDRFYLLDYFYQSALGLAGKNKLIKRVPTFVAGFAIGDILEESDGTQWRCFKVYNGTYIAIKEV